MASVQTSTIVYASIGTALGGALAYAAYFDYRRRNDPEFRRSLKRESKRQAKAAKMEAEVQGRERIQEMRAMVDEVNEEGFPSNPEETSPLFMEVLSEADKVQQRGDTMQAAQLYFKALKMYPAQKELMRLYDSQVPKPILDILAQMIAYDRHQQGRSSSSNSSTGGVE